METITEINIIANWAIYLQNIWKIMMQAWISKEQSQADDWQTYGKTDAGPRHTRHVTKGHNQQISKQQHDYSVLVMIWRKGSSIFSDPSQKRWQWSCRKFIVNWCHSLVIGNNRSSASVSMASAISAANHFLWCAAHGVAGSQGGLSHSFWRKPLC